MAITDVRDASLSVLPNSTYHYEAPEGVKAPYIVWGEDSQGDAKHGDNIMVSQSMQGTLDYFTYEEYDPNIEKIQRSLSAKRISFYLQSVEMETDTKLIHYVWVWEVFA